MKMTKQKSTSAAMRESLETLTRRCDLFRDEIKMLMDVDGFKDFQQDEDDMDENPGARYREDIGRLSGLLRITSSLASCVAMRLDNEVF